MYVKFTANYMNGYIFCYFFDYKNDLQNFINISMNLIENPVSVGFQVNGLVLFPIVKDDDQIWYLYEYFDGEELTIQSLKDEHLYGEFECKVDMNPDVISEFKKPWNATNINIITNLKETRNITSVDCFVNYLNSTSRKGLDISLQLIPNTFDYKPFIKGLSMANMLAKLQTELSTTIYYEYEPRQVLNLICCSNTSGLLWEYVEWDVLMFKQTTKQVEDGDETMLSAIFKVKPSLTYAHIRCKNLKRAIDIELIRKVKHNQPSTDNIDSVTTQALEVKNLAVNVSNTEVIPELGGSADVLPGSFKLYANQQHATVPYALSRNLKELHDMFVKITRNNDIMMGSVYINAIKKDFGTVMYSEDYVTVYFFYEGELANISCTGNFNRNSLLIQLSAATNTSHVKGRRTITTGTQVNGPGEMKLKLTADYNGGYIACYISDFTDTQQLKILTKLKKGQDVGLKVNGFVLTPIHSVRKKLFTYEFLGEEELAIESVMDDERYGYMLCTLSTLYDVDDKVPVHDDPCHNEEYFFSSSFNISDRDDEERMYKINVCNMEKQNDKTDFEAINDFKILTVTTNLKKKMMLYCLSLSGKLRLFLNMVRKTIGSSPIIEGLSMSNVSAMYRSKTSNVIRYEYNNQGYFNLTCYSNTSGLQWEYDSYTVEKLNEKALVAEHRHECTLSAGFKLRFDRTNTRIKCILPAAAGLNHEEITEVELIWKPEYNQQLAESPSTADSTWHLMVNGDEVALNGTANTGTGAGAYYYYYDGDQVTFICRDTAAAYLKLVYTTKSKQTLETDPTDTEVEMYIKLTAAADDTHIDCYILIHNNSSILSKRLYFKLQPSPRKVQLGFIVNGLFLTSTPQLEQKGESKVYTFCYKYYEGEQIQIVSVKEEEKYGGVECVFKGKRLPKELQDLNHKQGSYNFTLYNDNKNITLECTVELKTPYDPKLRKNVTILLSLVPNIVDTAFYLTGLRMANILVKYMIHPYCVKIIYEYDDEEEINLKCYSEHYFAKWDYDPREMYKGPNSVNNNTKLSPAHHNVISAMFKMNSTQRISTISCDLNRYKHELNEISVTLTRRNNEDAPAAYANWAAMGVSCAVLLVLGASCAAYAVRKKSRETTAVDNRTPTVADTGTEAAEDEPVYASISEHVYEEPRPSSINMAGGMSGISRRPPHPLQDEGGMSGVSQRPPHPLPDEAFEENQTNTFVLYDVPYEWRIFRRGVTPLDDRGSWRKYKERQLKGKSRQY